MVGEEEVVKAGGGVAVADAAQGVEVFGVAEGEPSSHKSGADVSGGWVTPRATASRV